MYAIIKTGGKQYRVAQDDVIDVELLEGELGSHVNFEEVLFVNNGTESFVGEPTVKDFFVTGEVLGNAAGPKVTSLKYTPRQRNKRKWGHRQHYTRVKILEIGSSRSGKKEKEK